MALGTIKNRDRRNSNDMWTGIKAGARADLYKIPISRGAPTSRFHMRCITKFTVLLARSIAMLDAIVLAIGFAFFALSIGYVYACDRL
jgi:hypothetical protein